MAKILEIEWTTGSNVTGVYSGTESATFDDDVTINIYEWEEILLTRAARKLGWHGKLLRVNTTLYKRSDDGK